jgi:hypothetical protein
VSHIVPSIGCLPVKMVTSRVVRTREPIHFEDLDPIRFVDVTPQLAHTFNQRQFVESTGRGGSVDRDVDNSGSITYATRIALRERV